jgi:hypothetical protein
VECLSYMSRMRGPAAMCKTRVVLLPPTVMLKVLADFGASLAVKDKAGHSVFDVCRSEVCRVFVKEWHAAHGLHISGKVITE